MQITENMVNKFNERMSNDGSVVRLQFIQEPNYAKCQVSPSNMKYIDSYILNATDEFYKILTDYFESQDITLSFNNTRSIFWSSDFS